MALPSAIILIHRGYQPYLEVSLRQVLKSNPRNPIVLIGDPENSFLSGKLGIEHIDASSLSGHTGRISGVYRHLSGNSIPFELFCVQRWFMLLGLMQERGWDRCAYTDSDTLLYADIDSEFRQFGDFDLAYAGTSGHFCFVNGQRALSDFCAFVTEQYENPAKLAYLERFYGEYRKTRSTGGISDMFHFGLYARSRAKVIDLTDIREGAAYDSNFSTSDNSFDFPSVYPDRYAGETYRPLRFRTLLGRKAAVRENGKFYAWTQGEPPQKVEMKAFHFQGIAKSYMADFAAGRMWAIKAKIVWHTVLEKIYHNSKTVRASRRWQKSLRERKIYGA